MSETLHLKHRRHLLKSLAGVPIAIAAGDALASAPYLPTGTVASARLEALPGKSMLIKRSYRPPNFESPLASLTSEITANPDFFVRWHVSSIPEIDVHQHQLTIGSDQNDKTLTLSMADLKHRFEQVHVTAVCQCAGARRGYSDPHVPGVQWGVGAVGNATWTGVRLKDVLKAFGIDSSTIEVAYRGEDRAPLEITPRFVKSLPLNKALEEQTILAYAMNGAPIPHWNGAPLRLIVPGWVATYWMKQITRIDLLSKPSASFWMNGAYRLPKGQFASDPLFASQANDKTVAVTAIVVNSLITNLGDGQRVKRDEPLVIKGVAWDGGNGIESVEVSMDDGHTWSKAQLSAALSKTSFHCYQYQYTPTNPGTHYCRVRAVSTSGERQTESLIFTPAGYHNNVPHRVEINVV